MTANRYRRHAQLLAVPVSLAWGIGYVFIAAFVTVYWARLNIEYLNRVPNIELMKWVAVAGGMLITAYAYYVFIEWWEEYLESCRLVWLGWDTRY